MLNAYVFESLEQVREISAEWLQSYNEGQCHERVGGVAARHVSVSTCSQKFSCRSASLTGKLMPRSNKIFLLILLWSCF